MGAFCAEINHAHSFREGNGRTGKLVLDQLAERSSFALDWERVSGGEWNRASARTHPPAFSGRAPDRTPLVAVFHGLSVDREPALPGDAESDRARDAVRLAGLSHPRCVGEQLRTQVVRVGTNLNQVARLLNGGGGVGRQAEETLLATQVALAALDPVVARMAAASGAGRREET